MVDNNINLNLLKQFVIVAESKSLSEAAEKIDYAPSSISVNISTLEKQLGVKLFTRNPLKLTEIGKEVYKTVKKGFEDINFVMTIVESGNNIESGKLAIGCPSHIANFFLMKQIAKAVKDYPDLQITLDTESDSRHLIEMLENNIIDFAILDSIPNEYVEELEIKKIKSFRNIFISNEKINIEKVNDLEKYKFILSYKNKTSNRKLMEAIKEYNIELNPVLRCPTTEQRVDGAKLGIGIAYVIDEAAKEALNNREVYEVKHPIKLPEIQISLVYLKNHLTKVDKEFIKKYIIKK